MVRICTLNTNGIRSATRKGLEPWLNRHQPEIFCVQELKAQPADMANHLDVLAGMQSWCACAEKKGYSGVWPYTAPTNPAKSWWVSIAGGSLMPRVV